MNNAKFLRTLFLKKHLQTAASVHNILRLEIYISQLYFRNFPLQ